MSTKRKIETPSLEQLEAIQHKCRQLRSETFCTSFVSFLDVIKSRIKRIGKNHGCRNAEIGLGAFS